MASSVTQFKTEVFRGMRIVAAHHLVCLADHSKHTLALSIDFLSLAD